jgi:predicted transcriptional regulator of viral defense system
MESLSERALHLGEQQALFRSRDAAKAGISRTALSRLVERGQLVRVARGVYRLPEAREVDSIAAFSIAHPGAVLCLLSALALHGLTTQSPRQIWLAIGNKATAPRSDFPPLQVVRMADTSLRQGVQEVVIDGVPVRVTDPARTVADCFKFRSRVGLDVALEALRVAWDTRAVTMDDLWTAAQQVRMTNVMRPYLESLA